MLQGRLIFILFACWFFEGNFAQLSRSNIPNRSEDRHHSLAHRQRRQAPAPQAGSQQSANDAKPISTNVRLSEASLVTSFLADNINCKADIQKYCTKGIPRSIPNLRVLQCVDNLDNAVNLIGKECQNLIYKYKHNMTHNVRFDDGAMVYCKKDIQLLDECNDHTDERGSGRLISCLYDRLANITEPTCRDFINQLQTVLFTDWRLSEFFIETCEADIQSLKCGRLDDEKENLPHDQGAVVSCLSKSRNSLSKPCLKQISRLHEMQSDDYHLDRALYYACRDDRERLCSQVSSGNGRVYRCLYEQKLNSLMTADCREEINRRQKMVASNVLLDAPFIRACKDEMREHQCVIRQQDTDKEVSLVNVLLCLQDRIKKGEQVKDECRREMLVHRRMLMSDYAVSPKIVAQCKSEMIQHCASFYQKGASSTIAQRGGKMIHCLLNAARKENTFSPECLSTVKLFVRAIDPGSDIRSDPLLETVCAPVVGKLCPNIKPGDSNIILCLLDHLKHTLMTDECEDRLMEISYFMTRDWRLTPQLLSKCQTNLKDLCQLPIEWSMTSNMSDVHLGKYLSCLYRQKQQLTSECRTEFQRIMRIRTQSIGLQPEIEENCIQDLATCKNPEVKGTEIRCLQGKYKTLENECKEAIKTYTKMTIEDPTLDFLLMKTCQSMVQIFCTNADHESGNDMLQCLIRNKNNPKMDHRCKNSIEYRQIISLKDAAFLSKQFQTKCQQEIAEHCSTKQTKQSVVQCLAKIALQDALKKMNRINDECRTELKYELLQRSESINFDPALSKACQRDISKFCATKTAGNAQIIDCLKANGNKVSATCYAKLKIRQKIDVVLPGADYSLTTNCGPLIQKYCSNANKQNILSCLRRNINQDATPTICRTVLYHRLMTLNSDARFNKDLIENCQNDINKHCSNDVIGDDDYDNDDDDDDDDDDNDDDVDANDDSVQDRDMGGRIIGCLRSVYSTAQNKLDQKCIAEITDIIEASKLDIQLDIELYQKCKTLIINNCSGVDKEDCLKLLYQNKNINDQGCVVEVQRIIKEGQADIHIDQMLSSACRVDLLKHCNDIPIGSSRQLQCLLRMSKSLTNYCRNILAKRQELWKSISHIDDIDDLALQITSSKNNHYLYSIIFALLFAIFITGCLCRPCIRYRRVKKYK